MKNKTLMKTLSTILAVLMLLCSAPLSGFVGIELPDWFSLKTEAYYTEGNFTYSVYSGKATLTGCVDATGDIVIPETLGGYPVTSIDYEAFSNCTSLTSVTIPDGVTSIGGYAFEDCTSLASITIPDSVTIIGGYAFEDCTSLTSITIPDGVTSIRSEAFCGCTSLASITIPDSVTIIGGSAFYNCTSLTSVTIPNSVTIIDDYAFYNCTSLASVTIGNSVTIVGDCVFEDCTSLARVYYTGDIESWCGIEFGDYFANPMYYAKNFYINNTLVKEIVIPDTVTEIKDYAFYSFEGITSITIPDSVTNIGYAAFRGCTGLTSVTIPNSVTRIEDDVFYNCTSLENVYYTGDIASWCNISFDTSESNPMHCAEKFYINNILVKEIVIPDTATEIKDYTFYDFDGITSVAIPDSVTSIGGYAFYNCTSLASITIPDNVTSVGEYAFCECDSLISIVIPEGVTSIRESAFRWCYGLTSVTIPESVITIREGAFAGCYNIENVYYAGTDEQWNEIAIYDGNERLNLADKTFLNGGHAHVYNSSVTTEPTCTETGVKTYKCYCGNTYTESIPATGHIWGKWIVTVEPTATKDGRKVRACTVCVEAVQEETIPKGTSPEEPSEPETKFSVKVNDFTLNYKGTAKLNPEIKSLLKYNVEYSSSDESVVTVDKDGNVTATGEGTAEITVRVINTFGMTVEDTCKVTVAKAWWQWLIIIFLFGWIWYI